jgi:hypothetical protein
MRSNGRSEMKGLRTDVGRRWSPRCVWDPTVFVKSRLQTKVGRRWCREIQIASWNRTVDAWVTSDFLLDLLGVPRWWVFVKDPLCVGGDFRCGPLWLPKTGVFMAHIRGPKWTSTHQNTIHWMPCYWLSYGWTSTELISGFTSVTHSVRSTSIYRQEKRQLLNKYKHDLYLN